MQNFRQHTSCSRAVAKAMRNHGVQLALEYIGPKTSQASSRCPFILALGELRELISEIDIGNVGAVPDNWHWWSARDTVGDLLALKATDVVAVDLDDAPAGIPKQPQTDGRRELPCAKGVIDVGTFRKALNQMSYDGPVRVEPFTQAVNKMSWEEGCAAAAACQSAPNACGLKNQPKPR